MVAVDMEVEVMALLEIEATAGEVKEVVGEALGSSGVAREGEEAVLTDSGMVTEF